jgi:hypothetical protein
MVTHNIKPSLMMLIHDPKKKKIKERAVQTSNMTKNREDKSRGKIRAERSSPAYFKQRSGSSKHVANATV